MSDDDVFEIQRLYPQIYIACHTDHVRAVSTKWRISSQDASILVHLDRDAGLSPRALANHLGVGPSTLSAAIARLAELGYLTNEPNGTDRRKRELRLTARGAEAIAPVASSWSSVVGSRTFVARRFLQLSTDHRQRTRLGKT